MVAFQMPREDEDVKLEVMCKLTNASAEIMKSIARMESSSARFAILEAIVEKLDEAARELRSLSPEV